jgi:hypothetical protein
VTGGLQDSGQFVFLHRSGLVSADGAARLNQFEVVHVVLLLGASVSVFNQKLADARTPQEKTALERQITATDIRIGRLVYDLYGLTSHEIGIVEGEVQ